MAMHDEKRDVLAFAIRDEDFHDLKRWTSPVLLITTDDGLPPLVFVRDRSGQGKSPSTTGSTANPNRWPRKTWAGKPLA
jgi:hypothetical protein